MVQRGVSLGTDLVEERWLVHFVVVMLVLDVAADEVFVQADRRDEVSACPEGLPFVESMRMFDLLLHPC